MHNGDKEASNIDLKLSFLVIGCQYYCTSRQRDDQQFPLYILMYTWAYIVSLKKPGNFNDVKQLKYFHIYKSKYSNCGLFWKFVELDCIEGLLINIFV